MMSASILRIDAIIAAVKYKRIADRQYKLNDATYALDHFLVNLKTNFLPVLSESDFYCCLCHFKVGIEWETGKTDSSLLKLTYVSELGNPDRYKTILYHHYENDSSEKRIVVLYEKGMDLLFRIAVEQLFQRSTMTAEELKTELSYVNTTHGT